MAYIVYIKQLATAVVRTRVEDSEWHSDSRLWTRGSRACDCARALLFAQDQEVVTCPCGTSAYAIRVASADGLELYCEEEFEPLMEFDNAGDDLETGMITDSPVGERLGAFARHAFDRLAVQITHYTASERMTPGRQDPG